MFKKINLFFSYNRDKYENILDDPNSKIGRLMDRLILTLVIIFPFVLTFESIGNFSTDYVTQLYIFDAFISIIFAIEYFYRFIRSNHKFKFLVTPIRIIDLLSFLPFLLGFFTAGKFLGVLKILRALRVLRIVKRLPLTSGFIHSLKDYLDEYRAVFTLYFVILFLGSFFVFFVEKDVNTDQFGNIADALWWGIVTTATVGYGDMSPITPLGKAIGSILVFLGPLLGGLVSAVTIMVFMENSAHSEREKNKKGKICNKCKTRNLKSANYCMKCGNELQIKHESEIIGDNRL